MKQNIWKIGRTVALIAALAAMVGTGTADARGGGVGKTVEGTEVTDGTLTGADIDESTLEIGALAVSTKLGTGASQPIGYPAIKTATATSQCPAGTTAVSGLVDIFGAGEPDNVYLTNFGPSLDGKSFFATAKATNSNPSVPAQPATLRVFAICLG